MFLLRIQGEIGGSKITLLGQNRFGAYFYAYKRKSKLTFPMTENAKSLKYCPNTLRFNDFEAKIEICWISGSKVDLASELQSSSEISTIFFAPSQLFTTCPWLKETSWSHFHTFLPVWKLIDALKLKKLLQIKSQTTILKIMHLLILTQ